MRAAAIGTIIAVALSLGVPALTSAQEPPTPAPHLGWNNVSALSVDSEVEIQTMEGRTASGRLVQAEPMALIISRGGRHQTLRQDEIRRVVVIRRQTARLAKRGFLVGVIAGGVWGIVATRSNGAVWSLIQAGSWGALGAGIGASEGASQRERTVVYEAENK